MKASRFLQELWGQPPRAPMLVWEPAGRRSHWLNAVEDADRDWPGDTYTGVSLPDWSVVTQRAQADGKGLEHIRAKAFETIAVPGLWCDLDYEHPVHKKPDLPPQAECLKFIEDLSHTPTIVVDSGHGYQLWWLFADGPWYFFDQWEKAQALVQQWQSMLRERLGHAMDATHDLARVMRLPGSRNLKGDPVDVTVVKQDGVRLVRRLWEQTLLGKPARKSSPRSTPKSTGPGLVLQADAEPSLSELEALYAAIPDAERSMKHTKKLPDMSTSGYDLSLASYAVQCGWDDQRIATLIVYHRRKHGADLQLGHARYYEMTIAKARETQPLTTDAIEAADDPKQVLLDALGFDVDRILMIYDPEGVDKPIIRLMTGNGRRLEMGLEQLTSNIKFRNICAQQLLHWPPPLKGPQWDAIVRVMLKLVERVTPGHPDHPQNPGDRQEILDWAQAYFDQTAVFDVDSDRGEDTFLASFLSQPGPSRGHAYYGYGVKDPSYVKGGRKYLVLRLFQRWLANFENATFTDKQLGKALRDAGFKPDRVQVPQVDADGKPIIGTDGKPKTTSRNMFQAPARLY